MVQSHLNISDRQSQVRVFHLQTYKYVIWLLFSGSSERSISNSSCSKNLPRHPFVQDPNIPPFAYHNLSTDIHLEETRRRLEVDQNEKMYRSSASSHGWVINIYNIRESVYYIGRNFTIQWSIHSLIFLISKKCPMYRLS